MRYEDVSQNIAAATSDSATVARPDVDTLPPGSFGPATGNAISGAGTTTGTAGADSAGAQPAAIVEVTGAGGATSASGGNFQAVGQYGLLSMDTQGNFNYVRNAGTPDGVQDVFGYTLADAAGARSSTTLTIDISQVATAAAGQAVVNLPPGVELSDIKVVGRDLVITMPDGTQMVIPGGAVFVPQLVIGDVQVPASNLAALLVNSEPQPAAGQLQSSGGNFAADVPPLDPGVPLGDLIPPTELDYTPPDFEDVGQFVDREPEITIQPDGQPASLAAIDSVDEDGLPTRNGGEPEGSGEEAAPGTNGDPDEATAGVIHINSPDGVDSVTINGVVVTGVVGQVIQGQYGTLVITGFLPNGDITYTYTLTDNTSGDATHDDFTVVVTDDDGDTATATLRVDIVDDVPTARNDTDAVVAGTTSTDGNVMTSVGTTNSPAGRDTVGADNATLTSVASVNVPANSDATFDSSGNLVVQGQYGTLTIKADGSYVYTLNPNAQPTQAAQEVFTYTLTDGDGDVSTATLTIDIPPDLRPTLDAPDAGEAGTMVDEAGLPPTPGDPAGTGEAADGDPNNQSDDSETTTGTITFTPGDSPATVTINGVVVTGVGQTFVGDYGTLTITGYNPNGSITYSYTLTENVDHDTDTTPYEEFDIVVTDSDGDTASDTLRIDIVDDEPIANNDTDTVAAGTFGPETGNVITGVGTTSGAAGADLLGADDATLTAIASVNVPANSDTTFDGSGNLVVQGQYGTLTIKADGSYSYVRDPGTPGGVSDVFTYTVTDGDGDTDTATLTINIGDATPVTRPNPLVQLDDDALSGGNPGGTGDDPDSVNASGTLSGSGGDGTHTFSVQTTGAPAGFTYVSGGAGVVLIQQGGVTVLTVTINPNGTYTVVQNAPIDHPAGSNENNVSFTINYTVTDADGDTASGTLDINVDDDTPVAANDTDTIASGSLGPATGNVITDASAGDAGDSDTGADSVGADTPGSITGIASNNVPANTDTTADGSGNFVVNGQYGTLTINADGSYSYARNPGTPGGVNDVFTYTLTDADGDTTTATLTISIGDATPVVGANAAVGLDDDALAGGNPGGTGDDPDSVNTSGTLSGSGGDGTLTFSVQTTGAPAGFTYVSGGPGVVLIQQGGVTVLTVTVNPNGTYTVVQNAPIDHAAGGNENNQAFTINYTVTDVDGDTASGTLNISVDDDTPIAANDTDTIASGSLGPATGNVITDAAPGDAGDGDTGADSVGADTPGSITGIASNNVPANTDTTADGSGNFVVNGQYGTLTINADGSYSYARNPGTPGGVNDVFTYTLTDGDGDSTTATLTISIGDNVPTVGTNPTVQLDDDALAGGNPGGTGDDPNSVNTSGTLSGSGGDGTLTFSVQTTGAPAGFTYVSGGPGVVLVQQGGVTVLTVTVNSNGTYSVVQNAPIDHPAGSNENNVSFTISYTVTDVDGDTANGTLNINVDDDTPIAVNDVDSIVSGGTGPATGNVITGVDIPGGDANATDGSADSVGADTPGSITGIASNNVPANVDTTADGSGNFVVVGQYGTLTINADGSYSYVRNAGTPGNVSDVFTYTLTDADGDTTTATLTINIQDAAPTVGTNPLVQLDDDALSGGNPGGTGDDPNSVNASGTLSGSGGDGTLTFSVQTTGAPAGFTYVSGGAGVVLIQQGGVTVLTVTVNSNGTYTVVQNAPIDHPAGSAENNVAFTINYTVTDADGDTANGTLNINVDDDTPIAANDTDTIASGSLGPATGNVITDAAPGDAGDGDTGADSVGADTPGSITGIASNNVPANTDTTADGSGNFVVNGQYGTLTINADGSYSYARNPGTPGGVSDVFTYTLTDGDGDSTTATLTISIGDATPSTGQNPLVQLDDDALSGGNPGGTGDDANAVNTSGTLSGSGGDGTLTFAVQTTGAPAGFTYVSGGPGVVLVQQGGVTVLTVTVNPNGTYTVVQNAPIDHPAGSDENNVAFTINYTVTDADGDTANGTLNINVDDDTPINFTPQDMTDKTGATPANPEDDAIVNDGTGLETNPIHDTNNDGVGENFIGADGFGDLTFTATGHTNGEVLRDANGLALTSGGKAVYMTGYGTDTLTAYQESGANPGYQPGEDTAVVFTVTLNEGTGFGSNSTYTIDFNMPLDDGSGFIFDDFSTAPAGQNEWVGLDSDGNDINVDNNDSQDLLLTPTNAGGSINTSSTDIGNSNQWIDNGEGVRIDYVVDVRRDGALDEKDAQGYTFDSHYTVTDSQFTVMQVQGGGTAAVRITAFSDPDTGNIKTLSGSIVAIDPTSIVVTGDTTYTVVAMPDGSVVIYGLDAGATVSFETVGDAPFNSFSVSNAGGVANPNGGTFSGSPFAIGEFGFESSTTGDPIDLAFGVTATDGDGDTSTGTIDVTLVPAGSTTTSTTASTMTVSHDSVNQDSSSLSLIATNDNGALHRAFAVGQNATLMGVVAAAGLTALHYGAGDHLVASIDDHGFDLGAVQAQPVTSISVEPQSFALAGQELAPSVSFQGQQVIDQTIPAQDAAMHIQSMTPQQVNAPAMTDLLQGTVTAAHGQTADLASQVAAMAVAMPSADQLAVVSGPALVPQSAVAGVQHNEIVGQVLADALNGGGHGPNLEAALNALPGNGGVEAALDALASHGPAAVSNGHMADFAGFSSSHGAFTMDPMVIQQDAAPAHV